MNSESILLLFGEWLAKGVVVLLAAGLVARALRRASAAQRHFVWLAAITILLILPVTRLMAPRWKVALADKPQRTTITLPTTPVAPVVNLAPLPQLPAIAPKKSATWRLPDWRKLALGLWLAGACGIIAARLLGSWRLRDLKRRAASLQDEFIASAAERVFSDFDIGQIVTVRVSNECRVPMTWGIWRPVLLLPVEALEWSGTRITAALQHEAGHIKRRDYVARWLAHLACALYWPNPFVWLAARALRVAQEQATDDLVLRAGTPPEEYASQLFDTARTVAAHGMFTSHAVAMASPSTLEDRVLAIVDAQRDRRPLGRLGAILGALAVALILAVCTAAQVRGADPVSAAKPGDASASSAETRPQQIEIETKFVEITGEIQELEGLFAPPQGIFTDPQFQVIIRALNQRKGVDLLSAPRVTTKSKQGATVEILREFRYPTDWKRNEKGLWAPVEFATKPTGVTLEVMPEVKRDGSINLQLKTSLVEFLGFTDIDAAEARPPGDDDAIGKRQKPNFDERKMEAKADVGDGQTLALSYRIKTLKQEGEKDAERKMIIFVSARIIDPNPPANEEAAKSTLHERINQIVIPKLELREKTLEECVAILRKESVEHSADGKGVNIIVREGAKSDARITVSLTNIPLAEALRYVAALANFKWRVEPYAVAVMPEGEAETLITKEWKVAPDLIPLLPSGGRQPAKEWLIEQGIAFKDAATAVYIPRTSRLIVRNNQDQLDLIDVIVETNAKGSEPDKKEAKAAELKEPAATEMIRSKLEGTIIPKLEWRDVPVAEVVDLLNKRARELDPAAKGVEIVLKPGAGREARITLSLSNVPLVEALRYVAGLSNLQVVVEPNRVVLQPASGAAINTINGGTFRTDSGDVVSSGPVVVNDRANGLTFGTMTLNGNKAVTMAGETTIGRGATLNFASPVEGALNISARTAPADKVVELMPVRAEFPAGTDGGQRVKLHLTIKARPQARLDVRDLEVRALFYDSVGGHETVPTLAEVNSEWKNAPADWADGTEELVVNYRLPKALAGRENRKYYGYVVRVNYKGQVQGAAAEPASLIQVEEDKFPADRAKAAPPAVYGVWVPGKPGFVVSPFDVAAGYVDVRGFKPETEVKCPYSGQIFRVPPLPSDAEGAKALERPGLNPIQEGSKESRIEGRAGVLIKSANPALDRSPINRRPGQN